MFLRYFCFEYSILLGFICLDFDFLALQFQHVSIYQQVVVKMSLFFWDQPLIISLANKNMVWESLIVEKNFFNTEF